MKVVKVPSEGSEDFTSASVQVSLVQGKVVKIHDLLSNTGSKGEMCKGNLLLHSKQRRLLGYGFFMLKNVICEHFFIIVVYRKFSILNKT